MTPFSVCLWFTDELAPSNDLPFEVNDDQLAWPYSGKDWISSGYEGYYESYPNAWVDYRSGWTDSRTGYVPGIYVVAHSTPLYLSAGALDLGADGAEAIPGLGAFVSGRGVVVGPATNDMTPNGLPTQEATALGNLAQNSGPPDGVSRSAPPTPTATRTALAALGRDPTDRILPTAGSQAVDPPPGSHEEPIDLIRPGDVPAAPLTPLQAAVAAQPALDAQMRGWFQQLATVRRAPQRTAYLENPALAGTAAAFAGLGQGVANTLNGLQDGLVGMVNLIPLAINKVEGNHVPYLPSPDWSRDLIVSESDWGHDASKFLGGTGASILVGGGVGRVAGAAGTGAAGAQTVRMIVQTNGQLAVAAASTGVAVAPVAAGVSAGAGIGAIGQNVQMAVAPGGEHFAEWELTGPRGGRVASGDETSGIDFALKPGQRLTFPEQSWYGHTEGKVISDLMEAGKLGPRRRLSFSGTLPPCPSCQNLMSWTSAQFKMEIRYEDVAGNLRAWKNGALIARP